MDGQSLAPTRAEANDVATAVYQGADAVMLSAESAVGRHPTAAVAIMDRIIAHTESHGSYRPILHALESGGEPTVAHAVAASATTLAASIRAAAMVAFTDSGNTATRVARERSRVPIVGVTPDERTARRMALLWGVHSVKSANIASFAEMVEQAVRHAQEEGFAGEGQTHRGDRRHSVRPVRHNQQRAEEIRHVEQRIGVGRLDREHVEGGAGDMAALQPRLERGLVDDAAARAVDQHRAGLHLVEHLGRVHADGGGVARQMDGQHVGARPQLLGLDLLYAVLSVEVGEVDAVAGEDSSRRRAAAASLPPCRCGRSRGCRRCDP